MKRSAIALALLAALLPACLAAEPAAVQQPASLAAPEQPAVEPGNPSAEVLTAPELFTPTQPQPEWRGWPSCSAFAPCGDGTGVSCIGAPNGSKPICISGEKYVSCNGVAVYCDTWE